jgi:hypothetical protein
MPDEVIQLNLTSTEAVNLVSYCNISYLKYEQSLANTPATETSDRQRLRNSMAAIQKLKEKIKIACENRDIKEQHDD